MKSSKYIVFVSIVLLFGSPAIAADINSFAADIQGTIAITDPSADLTLSFTQPGRIARINVREGDIVDVDQSMVELDNKVEKIRLAELKDQGEEMSKVEGAKASLEQKKVDLKKIEWAASRNSATKLEVEHAKLDVRIAELSLAVSQFEHEQNIKKYEEARASIERMIIKSPVKGRVEKIEKEVGESVNALEAVIRVVKTDPLWIDVPVHSKRGRTLKAGMAVKVQFPQYSGQEKVTGKGRIIFVSTVIDAASDTLRVRVQVPNKSARSAGEKVRVFFPNSIGK